MKFLLFLVFLVCVSGAFGQPNSAYYVSTSGNDSNPGSKLHLGARFNMPQTPRARARPLMCEQESTKSL